MTTIALVAGMIRSSSDAARARQRIAQSACSSSAANLCLLLTLLAVPVFYSLFEDMRESTVWSHISGRTSAVKNRARRSFSHGWATSTSALS
jgi:HAE1 family hydrophobic/amphiphilic exporter-1